jgi:hypothetical protein
MLIKDHPKYCCNAEKILLSSINSATLIIEVIEEGSRALN